MLEFETLYKNYYPQVYRYVLKLCGDETLAEEITQETFFKVLKNVDNFKGDCKFSVWVCQIAKNTLYTHLKRKKRLADFSVENQEKAVMAWIAEKGYHLGNVMNAFRLTLVGEGKGPHIFDITAVLGKEESLRRIRRAVEVL